MKKIELIDQDDLAAFCLDKKEDAKALLHSTRRTYGFLSDALSRLILPKADKIAKNWLHQTSNPYRQEIDQYASILNDPGIYALNLSYEWGCTSGAFEHNDSPDMLRILDWPFPGLGEAICIVNQAGEAGHFYNVTWPAVSGVFQAMAPGRFSASINQAPMRRHGLTYLGDWVKNRKMFYKEDSLPPAHLLRHVFEVANDYEHAKELLINTPICMPVIFSLAGINNGEACVIERLEREAVVRPLCDSQMRVSVSNHFQTTLEQEAKKWMPRSIDSPGRAQQIDQLEYKGLSAKNFDWLSYPMINKLTRLCMVANAKDNHLMIQGWEEYGAATELYRH